MMTQSMRLASIGALVLLTLCPPAMATAASSPGPGSNLRPIDRASLQALVNRTARELHLPGALVLLHLGSVWTARWESAAVKQSGIFCYRDVVREWRGQQAA